jgi:membrane protein required for colicin V production
MNIIDMVIAGLVFFIMLIGFSRGIVKEALGLLRWAAVAYCLNKFFPTIKGMIIAQVIHNEMGASVCAFILIFIITTFFFTAFVHALSAGIRSAGIGGFDRFCGGIFGVAKASLMLAAFNICVMIFEPAEKYPEVVKQSISFPIIMKISLYLLDRALPDYIKKQAQVNPMNGNTMAMNAVNQLDAGVKGIVDSIHPTPQAE